MWPVTKCDRPILSVFSCFSAHAKARVAPIEPGRTRKMEKLLLRRALDHGQATRLAVVFGTTEGKRTSGIADILRIHSVSVSTIVGFFNERGADNHKPGKAPRSEKVINRALRVDAKPTKDYLYPLKRIRQALCAGQKLRGNPRSRTTRGAGLGIQSFD